MTSLCQFPKSYMSNAHSTQERTTRNVWPSLLVCDRDHVIHWIIFTLTLWRLNLALCVQDFRKANNKENIKGSHDYLYVRGIHR